MSFTGALSWQFWDTSFLSMQCPVIRRSIFVAFQSINPKRHSIIGCPPDGSKTQTEYLQILQGNKQNAGDNRNAIGGIDQSMAKPEIQPWLK